MNTVVDLSGVSITHKLPCGHVITGATSCQHPLGGRWIDDAAETLKFWVKDRTERHQCALVSNDNANGTAPREVHHAR